MRFFLEDVFPLIKARCPQTTLRITGKVDETIIGRLPRSEGVIHTGYLEEVRPTIAASNVSVVPLLEGGGTRLKILEAMALYTPVVSTSLGAQGITATHGKEILIADDPRAFSEAVCSLLENASKAQSIAKQARALVESRYSWSRIGETFNSFLEDVKDRWQPKTFPVN